MVARNLVLWMNLTNKSQNEMKLCNCERKFCNLYLDLILYNVDYCIES